MSATNNLEAFREAHHFNLNTLNIGGPPSAPAPPHYGPTYNNWGTMQQSNGAPNGGPVTMTQSGFTSNLGGSPGKAYQTPPASGPNTPAPQSPQSAPQVQDSNHSQSQPRTDYASSPPDPYVHENWTGKPSRPPLNPNHNLPTPSSSTRPPSSVVEKEDGMPEKEWERSVSTPKSPLVATSPSGPLPRARHTVFIANGAKMALENSAMPDIRRLFSKAGLKNSEWIAQAGYNEEELHDRGCYEEVVVFTILNTAVSVKSIDRKKLKSLFPKYPVVIRSHSGEDCYLERGGKSPAVNTPAHQHEADLLENLATRTASVSPNLPKSLDQANIKITAQVGLAGLSNSQAQLIIKATLAHKETAGDNDDPQRSLEFSKLSFETSGGHIPFFQRSAHVLVMNGEKSINVMKPVEVSPVMDTFKEATASRTTKSVTYGGGARLSGAPAVIGQISRTNGNDTQNSSEKTLKTRYIKTEDLRPGVKVKYQSTSKPDHVLLQDKFDLGNDSDILPTFSIPISSSSSSRTQTELADGIMRIRLTSLWTYRGGKDDISESQQLGALKRLWRRVTARHSKKESSPRSAPGFTNLVHCVDLELSTESRGMVRDWQIESPKPVDMKMDI